MALLISHFKRVPVYVPSSRAVPKLLGQLSGVLWLEREGTVGSGTPVLLEIMVCPSASGGHQENVFEIQTLLYSWQHEARAKVPVQPTVATLCSEVSEEHACLPSASCSAPSPCLISPVDLGRIRGL